MLKISSLLLSILLFSSCSSPESDKSLKISATTWIGYTPLFYAKEMNWLKQSKIKLLHVVSLSENMYIYKAGNSDAYVGTQYEHSVLKGDIPSLIPILMFDRSNGGDMVMSNVSIASLQESDARIDVYLEVDSVNILVLEDFIKTYHIARSRLHYINKDQVEIANLEKISSKHPTLIVTYTPFDSKLKKQGFKELLNTKHNLNILVVDAMYTKLEVLREHEKQFRELKQYIKQAIVALRENPKDFFGKIKPYMEGMNYDQFISGLQGIEWIHERRSKALIERMLDIGFSTKDLL